VSAIRISNGGSANSTPAATPPFTPCISQPADVSGELLRFRSGQQHAVIQRMQKAPLGNPAAPFHQFQVHHGNLPGRAAEADGTELESVFERFAQADWRGWVGDGNNFRGHFIAV